MTPNARKAAAGVAARRARVCLKQAAAAGLAAAASVFPTLAQENAEDALRVEKASKFRWPRCFARYATDLKYEDLRKTSCE